MGGLIVFSVLIISILEILASKSSGDANSGGLVFAADIDKIPTISSFGYFSRQNFAAWTDRCVVIYIFPPSWLSVIVYYGGRFLRRRYVL